MGKLFGTDGIRGVANETLDAPLAYRVGQATAIGLSGKNGRKPTVVIGKDTRISSDMLEGALIAGLTACGANVVTLGVIPTPAVAFMTVYLHADAGAVISASHNPYEHNGIKLFSGEGYKLSDALEAQIEALILQSEPLPVCAHDALGQVTDGRDQIEAYLSHLAATIRPPKPLRVLIDCANGAASTTARALFSRVGLQFEIINDKPNGININDGCGSTHLAALSQRVKEGAFDVGVAFDGDADRCLAVDVNADRYDDRVDALVSDRVQNYQSGKQKIGNKNKKQQQAKKFGNKARSDEQEKMRRLQLEIAKKAPLVVKIPDEITVGELAARMKKTAVEVIKCLMRNGVMATVNQTIDFDTAEFVAVELGCKVEREIVVTIEEKLFDDHEDTADELISRPPVIVVMGHVDHGKTSLLDYVRHAKVAAGEAGGITQHIGAYTVKVNGQPITFLDTPGHAAFTEMRARGAMCTDIAILVVAADDGIMPQTIEAINHAKAADIPIIVAVNKMDKHAANPDRILTQLTEHGLVPAEWGGETEVCKISAKTGMGIDDLLETVLLTAEMQELKANPNRAGKGSVIEARLDKTRGPIATLLVQNGTLHQGDLIIAGTAVGRVRVMTNDKGLQVKDAGPSIPVEITGLTEVPAPGDDFSAVADERMARQLVEQRKQKIKDDLNKLNQKVTLESLFSKLKEGEMKELNLIVKADVQGSAEAVKASLEKISNEEVRVKVIHAGVGAINESDILLASTSNAIVVGFNVRPNDQAQAAAKRDKVDMRMYRVIYDAINEISDAMKGMLAPKFREAIIGHAEVRQTYKVSSVGTVAGCYVKDGKITRDAQVRVLRDNIVIHEGVLGSLQRFKDSVREVAQNYECGMSIDKFNDIKEGDIFECFIMEQIKD